MSEGKPKIRFAVVGCGHIGKRHIALLSQNKNVELLAVIDPSTAALAEPRSAGIPCYGSLEEFLKTDQAAHIDVFTVAAPNGLHASLALKILEAKKHVVLEKPMAITKTEAEQLIHKSLDVHRHVFVVKQNRYSPPSLWLKKIMEDRVLGKIFMVQINCFWNRDERYYTPDSWHGSAQMDGGILFTQFSHFIDIMYWVFGDIRKIHSQVHNYRKLPSVEFEDCGAALFEFVNGGMGSIHFSTAVWDKNMESSVTVIAENGSLKIGGQYMNIIEYCHIKNYTMPQLPETRPGNQYAGYTGSAANHELIFENVVNVLQNGTPISANAFEGMKVVDIIERIYQGSTFAG